MIELTYDDVLLIPKYSTVSRKEVDTSVDLGKGLILKVPFISTPMDTISGTAMAMTMRLHGGSCIIHRYCTIGGQWNMWIKSLTIPLLVGDTDQNLKIGAAIGVSRDYLERAEFFVNQEYFQKYGYLCVDVAHADTLQTHTAIGNIRKIWKGHLMVGNVVTEGAVERLKDLDVDSVRVGIGSGSRCTTRIVTGNGRPMLSAIRECSQVGGIKILADGGIRNSGDIVKAFAFGADAVILGGVLAGSDATPGKVFEDDEGRYKNYRGMASYEALENYKGEAAQRSSVEGVSMRVEYRGPTKDILCQLEQGLRAGMVYQGKTRLERLRDAHYSIISSNTTQRNGAF